MTNQIHHATRAKAEKLGVALATHETAEGFRFEATHEGVGLVATHDNAKALVAFAEVEITLRREYPGAELRLSEVGTVELLDRATGEVVYAFAKVPSLAKVLEVAEDEGLDVETAPEGFELPEDEDHRTGSVVAEHYKQEYKARGDANNCGDWLALFLKDQCHGRTDTTKTGKAVYGFQMEAFEEILTLNEVPRTGKWAMLPESGQKGWEGRYRMSGRQILEKEVAWNGHVVALSGERVVVPEDALAELQTKHAKALEKRAKAEAKAKAKAEAEKEAA